MRYPVYLWNLVLRYFTVTTFYTTDRESNRSPGSLTSFLFLKEVQEEVRPTIQVSYFRNFFHPFQPDAPRNYRLI